jgi:protoporphyrinogen oxidase
MSGLKRAASHRARFDAPLKSARPARSILSQEKALSLAPRFIAGFAWSKSPPQPFQRFPPVPLTQRNILIIGGGVAGLGAALELGRAGGFHPIVLEADAEAGGMARTLRFKGLSTDLGPHRLHTEIPEVYDLISDVCAPSLVTVRRKSRIYLRGRYIDYPPRPLETLAHLGPARVARFGFSKLLAAARPEQAEPTYETLMRRAFGPAAYDFLIRPYTKKVWKTDPAEIHPDTARVRVSAGSLGKLVLALFRKEKRGSETALREFRYVKGGVATMVRRLVERAEREGAEIRLSTPVESLELENSADGRFRVAAAVAGEDESERLPADAIVSTVPLPILLNDFLPPLPALAAARAAASGLTYLSMIFVIIIVRRRLISGDNWLYYPEPEWIFNRAYESKSFDPEMGPEDRSVLCVELTARPDDALWRESDDAIAEKTVAQLAATGLFGAGEVEERLVHRLRYGYPLYSLDYRERLQTALEGLASIDNLLTTGRQGLFNHNNTDHSIYMGLRAARAIAADPMRPAARWAEEAEEFKRFRIVD